MIPAVPGVPALPAVPVAAPAPRDPAVDVLHGVEVPDPYRWLEDGESADTLAWVAAQNARTREALDAVAQRARWHERLVALAGAPSSTSVAVAGDLVFSLDRASGAAQPALVVRPVDDAAAPARVLIDPAALADDAAAAIDWFHPSRDGRYVAYGTSEGGDERSVLRIFDVTTGALLADEIPDTRAASVGWLPDATGFLYTRYPDGDEYHRMVYAHTIGVPWVEDPLVFGDLPSPEAWPDVSVSRDGRWAVVTMMLGWSRTDVHLIDRTTGERTTVIEGIDAVTYLRVDGDHLLGTTTLHAPRGRVVRAVLAAPTHEQWVTMVPEGDAVIEDVRRVGDELVVVAQLLAMSSLHRHRLDGAPIASISMPGPSSLAGISAEDDRAMLFVQLESFGRPAAMYRYCAGGALEPWGRVELPFDPDTLHVERVTYPSVDGTEIGLFLVHRRDLTPGPDTSCILTGYGGFAIVLSPAWSPGIAAWCEAGGLYAIAGLRGGTEEGEAWHQAGMRAHKQNVFDDFHAAADFLVSSGRTSRARLALRGGSNGGLLMGVAITQRPDAARAVHCAVPLLDMVRFPQFLIAKLWTSEYGDPAVAEEFAWLWAYSPYHHVREGECYPAVLFTTADGDSRVDPCHARKMTALLQWAGAGQDEHPILLRVEDRAGHGVGKPAAKVADELADVFAFFTWQLGGPQTV